MSYNVGSMSQSGVSVRMTSHNVGNMSQGGVSVRRKGKRYMRIITFWEAMDSSEAEQWHAAIQEEYEGLMDMGVWKLVPQPKDHKMIKCRWMFVYKSNGQYKAWLVTKGFTQIQGIDYEETFYLLARYKSVWYLLPHTALLNWEIKTMDVKMAYLHGVLKEEIYMEQPEGFIAEGEKDKVCNLVLSLYGLKQAGQVWNRTFANTIKKKLDFETKHSDVGVYILHQWQGGITKIILILCVDDLLLLGKDQSEIEDVKCQLGELYHMKDLGPTSSYSGDSNHQRLQKQIYVDRSTSIHWKCTKEVQTSRCKQRKNSSPSHLTLREVWRNVKHWNQDFIPTDDQNIDLCCYWH